MRRILAVIPARGGSKGVPGKNLRPLAGKRLIVHSIEQALAAYSVTTVVVSTDDERIADVARAAGADVPFLRPAELATDAAPTEPTMRHALEFMETKDGRYDAIMLLQPTSPLRLPGTLERAIAHFHETRADSLLGVVESHAFFWKEGSPPVASFDYRNRPRRQDISDADRSFRETGSLYITGRDAFMAENNRLAGRIALFHMDEREGWEIDTEVDFAILEALMNQEPS